MKTALLFLILFLSLLPACLTTTTSTPTSTSTQLPTTNTPFVPVSTSTNASFYHSTPLMQVFILSPVRTCIAANDFVSGQVFYGPNCGDGNCSREEFDPPSPLTGIRPQDINKPQYADKAYRQCFNITLTPQEIQGIQDDMRFTRDKLYEWSEGAFDLQLKFTILAHDFTGFVAPDFVFGPFEVDDELLNPYVTTATDMVYVFSGVRDYEKGVDLAYWCGSSYGELSIRGASYAYIQYNDRACNFVTIAGKRIYEATIHELYHNIDWALYNLSHSPDVYQFANPDWAHWQTATWPACGKGVSNPQQWFPSIDLCEWDPDWTDCNNTASAGRCLHAGDENGSPSWYEHVIRAHYPRNVVFNGNFCRDGLMDFGETGVDRGGPCQ